MSERELSTQSVVFDAETREQLQSMAREDERTNSALIRWLIRQEFARRYSKPNAGITIEQAEQAAAGH